MPLVWLRAIRLRCSAFTGSLLDLAQALSLLFRDLRTSLWLIGQISLFASFRAHHWCWRSSNYLVASSELLRICQLLYALLLFRTRLLASESQDRRSWCIREGIFCSWGSAAEPRQLDHIIIEPLLSSVGKSGRHSARLKHHPNSGRLFPAVEAVVLRGRRICLFRLCHTCAYFPPSHRLLCH